MLQIYLHVHTITSAHACTEVKCEMSQCTQSVAHTEMCSKDVRVRLLGHFDIFG
jgi:hypothetical protein